MKYYSEVVHKTFDTVEELEKAEIEVKEKVSAEKNEKKELANCVQKAEETLNEAYAAYEVAVKDYNAAIERAREEILKPAKEAVRTAEKAKWEAVANFNKKFGRYTRTYTGDDAVREITRVNRLFDSFFDNFLF